MRLANKHTQDLRAAFISNLEVDFFDEDEIGSILGQIDSFEQPARQTVQALCLSLSNASSSLVPRVLAHIGEASTVLSVDELNSWVGRAFDLLDSAGIDQTLAFLGKNSREELSAIIAPAGVLFRDAAPMLEIFLQGISGLDLKISSDHSQYTDTVTVFFPSLQNRFPEREKNLLLYKLSAAFAWAQIVRGTLTQGADVTTLASRFPDHPSDIKTLMSRFTEQELALDLYTIIEAFRLKPFLQRELPGLMKNSDALMPALSSDRPGLEGLSKKTAFVELLYRHFLEPRSAHASADPPDPFDPARLPTAEQGVAGSIDLLMRTYQKAEELDGAYEPRPPLPFFGKIRPDRVAQALKEVKKSRRSKLEAMLMKLIDLPDNQPREPTSSEKPLIDPDRQYLLIKGNLVELDPDLKDIIEERGGLPGGMMVNGREMGNGSLIDLNDLIEEEDVFGTGGGIKYDEWDYKRGGYKKGWCSLYEQDIHPGHEEVVERTLKRYSGYVHTLRKRFELLKQEPRTLRRQKEGDDIDLDAVIEAFADAHAGISPGENVFTRLERAERNIAVLFLIDMSGSTKGWVNEAEKESLVLMAEALEALGDRYAVYGFSGMTRTRCDLYRVKGFDEPYAESVKRRIAGIEPRDYTRMGPFIRHAAGLLASIEARTKLLITLSDGKPEDWDGYKGDYGIEDTRKALIEAREHGIHPFCITIDKEAQSYLPHMFGEAGYIFIDDVRKLPNRITEIYRRLTT